MNHWQPCYRVTVTSHSEIHCEKLFFLYIQSGATELHRPHGQNWQVPFPITLNTPIEATHFLWECYCDEDFLRLHIQPKIDETYRRVQQVVEEVWSTSG